MTHKAPKNRPIIALYQPDIPQNTASIARSCACLGAYLEIIKPCGFFLSDKRFKRVVMDYMEISQIKFYKDDIEFFNAKIGNRIILMTTKAEKIYTDFNFKLGDTLLFGRESLGVPLNFHKKIKHKLKIPMVKSKRSLNLSTSVSITLAENLRQTRYLNG